MDKFLKPHIDRPGILDPTPGDPLGYCSNDGMWASIPLMNSKKFIVVNNGNQIKVFNTYKQSVDFIKKQIKIKNKKTSSLEKIL